MSEYIPKYKCPHCGRYPLDFETVTLRNMTTVFAPGEKPADFYLECKGCGKRLGVQIKLLSGVRRKTVLAETQTTAT